MGRNKIWIIFLILNYIFIMESMQGGMNLYINFNQINLLADDNKKIGY
jgi:hypothetical protein